MKKIIKQGPGRLCPLLIRNLSGHTTELFILAEISEADILKALKGKSGIYKWTNLVNGKSYVGSSINLTIRLNVYFNKNRLVTGSGNRMAIYQAISKYGLENFTLETLEYCCKDATIEREQFYLDKLQPEYNLLKKLVQL